ncbi:hypothetical protein [Streptomyces sp. NPDC055109]
MLQVEVWDSSHAAPTVQVFAPGRSGQHGLEIVAALAHALTVEQTPEGKHITAIIPLGTA